jgi:hypothetical protein
MTIRVYVALGAVVLANCTASGDAPKKTETAMPAPVESTPDPRAPGCDLGPYERDGLAPSREWLQRNALSRVAPVFPEDAVRDRIVGDVKMVVVVDRTGVVALACAMSGPTLLREAAVHAMEQCVFRPDPDREQRYVYDYAKFDFQIQEAEPKVVDRQGEHP